MKVLGSCYEQVRLVLCMTVHTHEMNIHTMVYAKIQNSSNTNLSMFIICSDDSRENFNPMNRQSYGVLYIYREQLLN